MPWMIMFSSITAVLSGFYFAIRAARHKADRMDKHLLPTGCKVCHGEGCPDCNRPLESKKLGKHEFERGDGFIFRCKHCGDISGLSGWQIVDMPPSMALCPMSPVRRTIWERMAGRVNCLAKSERAVKGDAQ